MSTTIKTNFQFCFTQDVKVGDTVRWGAKRCWIPVTIESIKVLEAATPSPDCPENFTLPAGDFSSP